MVAGTAQNQREADRRFLGEALELAVRIPRRPWPNPPVGAVVVRDGEVVGRGAHLGAGEPHAERVALAEAGERARGATIYCTLEPCDHHGRTPPCTEAILAAGVARVVAGVADLAPPAAGGATSLRAAGVEVEVGLMARRCLDLIWPFVCTESFRRPYVELKTATSLDGRFGGARDPRGRPTYLTGPEARRDVHRRRRWVDLVLVGHGTARHDHPRLDVRLATDAGDGPVAAPLGGCVASAPDLTTCLDRDHWLVFHPDSCREPLARGAEGVGCSAGVDGAVDCGSVMESCRQRGLHTVMLEGGPRLAASFLERDLVDRWVQYLAPVMLGDGPTWPVVERPGTDHFHLTSCERVGRDLRVIWDRHDFHAAVRARLEQGEVD